MVRSCALARPFGRLSVRCCCVHRCPTLDTNPHLAARARTLTSPLPRANGRNAWLHWRVTVAVAKCRRAAPDCSRWWAVRGQVVRARGYRWQGLSAAQCWHLHAQAACHQPAEERGRGVRRVLAQEGRASHKHAGRARRDRGRDRACCWRGLKERLAGAHLPHDQVTERRQSHAGRLAWPHKGRRRRPARVYRTRNRPGAPARHRGNHTAARRGGARLACARARGCSPAGS